MREKLKIDLGDVQRTLLIPLWGRALDYRSDNPLLGDKFAAEMVDRIDYDFQSMSRMMLPLQINSSIRAYNLDSTLKRIIHKHPDATIVNLGAGLDTTFHRVDNSSIFWYDLDLPDTMELRLKLIPEGDRNKAVAKSIFDRSWFGDIKVRGSKVFFISAGVLAYLNEPDIKSLFIDLASEFPGSGIMFETYAKWLVRMRNKTLQRKKSNSDLVSPLNWGVNSGKSLEKWSDQIKVAEEYAFYSKVNINEHWGSPFPYQLRLINYVKAMKMVHLEFK